VIRPLDLVHVILGKGDDAVGDGQLTLELGLLLLELGEVAPDLAMRLGVFARASSSGTGGRRVLDVLSMAELM